MSLERYLFNSDILNKNELIYKNYRPLAFQRALGYRDISNDGGFRAFLIGVQPSSQYKSHKFIMRNACFFFAKFLDIMISKCTPRLNSLTRA